MHRRLVIIVLAALLTIAVGSPALIAQASSRSSKHKPHDRTGASLFVGYWMGVDPLDGGDSRRGITVNADRTFSVIGRDTVFTLCDGTDRAVVTVGDAVVTDGALTSDNLIIACTNDQSKITLKVRYDLIDTNVVRETITTQSGDPVDKIIFHRVSER